jgi:hypothetical protein
MVASGPEVEPRCAEPLHRELSTMAGVRAAVDALNDRTVLVRMTAETGPAFYRARAAAAERLSLVPTINQKR